jgi:uncharacterized membrane protein
MVRPSRNAASLPGSQRQRGVAAIYAGVALIALVAALALAVDIGQLYLAQRDLQRLASNAAADAVRVASGCYTNAGVPGTLAAATAEVTNSLTRNLLYSPGEGGGAQPTAATVMQAYGLGVPNVQFGMYALQTVNGVSTRGFTPLSATDPRVDSIQVNLARIQPTPLIPFLLPGGGTAASPGATLRASASAQQSPVASFRIGSQLANLMDPLALCALLGAPQNCINVNAAASNSLANASVTLDQLAIKLGLGTSGQLLTTQLPLGTLVQGIADVLADTGQSAAAGVLDQLSAVIDPSRNSILGNVLGIEDDVSAVVETLPINAADIVNALALSAANGLYPIQLPITTSVPGVTLNAYLSLGQAQQNSTCDDPVRCANNNGAALGRSGFNAQGLARTQASTRQLVLNLRFGINTSALPLLGTIPLVGNLASINLGIDITGATADSYLASLNCPAPLAGINQPQLSIPVTTSAATVAIGTFSNASPSAPVIAGPLVAVGGSLLTINLSNVVSTNIVGSSGTLSFTGPFLNNNPPDANATGSIGLGGATLTQTTLQLANTLGGNLTIKVLGGLVTVPAGSLVAQILNVVQPVINGPVNTLLSSLGLNVAGATVTVLGVDYGTKSGFLANNSQINSQPVVFSKTKPVVEAPVPAAAPLTGTR